jgi:hypothetical protein
MSFDSTVIRPPLGDLLEFTQLEDRVADLEEQVPGPVQDELDQKPDSASIDTIVTLTQAEYDALTPDSRTLYIVVES